MIKQINSNHFQHDSPSLKKYVPNIIIDGELLFSAEQLQELNELMYEERRRIHTINRRSSVIRYIDENDMFYHDI